MRRQAIWYSSSPKSGNRRHESSEKWREREREKWRERGRKNRSYSIQKQTRLFQLTTLLRPQRRDQSWINTARKTSCGGHFVHDLYLSITISQCLSRDNQAISYHIFRHRHVVLEVNDRTEKEWNPFRKNVIQCFLARSSETQNHSYDGHPLKHIIDI